jgi:hypothetical protein
MSETPRGFYVKKTDCDIQYIFTFKKPEECLSTSISNYHIKQQMTEVTLSCTYAELPHILCPLQLSDR